MTHHAHEPLHEPLSRAAAEPLDSDAESLTPLASKARTRTTVLELGLVLAGGVVGTLVRATLSAMIGPLLDHGFPCDIALINLTGAFGLGLLAGWRDPQSRRHELIWLALAVGFLGAYTTFSSFALGLVTLAFSGQALLDGIYVAGSVGLGMLAVEVGLFLGERWRRS